MTECNWRETDALLIARHLDEHLVPVRLTNRQAYVWALELGLNVTKRVIADAQRIRRNAARREA